MQIFVYNIRFFCSFEYLDYEQHPLNGYFTAG